MLPETFLNFVLLLAAAAYVLPMAGLLMGLSRLRRGTSPLLPFVSVIVAARNEAANIGRLLEALVSQDYPDFEIIIVNDRSTDSTAAVVRSFQEQHRNIRLLEIKDISTDLPPKKNALTTGILESKGEVLCFTDADCAPGRQWLRSLVSYFDRGVGIVAGYSPYNSMLLSQRPHNALLRLLLSFVCYEELKGAIWSAGAIGLHKGWLCTGRNLAYRRAVWDEVGGFEHIKQSVSGDDDLFLQLVRRKTDWSIRYSIDPDSHVPTAPPSSFSAFVQQRKRHFSAGKYFTLSLKAFFFLFHLANLLIFLAFTAALVGTPKIGIGIPVFALKLLVDCLVVLKGTAVLSVRFPFSSPFMEVLYIFYNSLIGPLGIFGSFTWKPEIKTSPAKP